MGLNYQTKRLSDFRSEKSLRCDYKYVSSFKMNYQEFYSYKDLFDFVSYKKIELSQLDSFQYAEISNVNKLGEVEPITLSFSNRQEENESLFKLNGIDVEWMDYSGYPEYEQINGDFMPNVSILDLIFNTGTEAKNYISKNI